MRALALSVTLLLGLAWGAGAAPPYDGSTPLQCAIKTVMVCNSPDVCVRGTAQTVNLPVVLAVDVGKKVIGGAATGRTVRMMLVNHNSGHLIMHGQETVGATVWDMVVAEDSGNMTGSILTRGSGILLFGACTSG